MTGLSEMLHSGIPFSDITVQQISERTAVPRSAFYVHFADKNELLTRIGFGALWHSVRTAEDQQHYPSGPDYLAAAMTAALQYIEPNRPIVRAVLDTSRYVPDVAEEFFRYQTTLQIKLAIRIRQQQQGGQALGGDANDMAFALAVFNTEMIRQYVSVQTSLSTVRWLELTSLVWRRVIYGVGSDPVTGV